MIQRKNDRRILLRLAIVLLCGIFVAIAGLTMYKASIKAIVKEVVVHSE